MEIVHVDLGHASDEQFELALVEDGDKVLRDEFAEARHEGIELFLDPLGNSVLDDEVDILLLVLLCNWNIFTSGLQLDGDQFAESLFSSRECFVDDIRDIILPVCTSNRQ